MWGHSSNPPCPCPSSSPTPTPSSSDAPKDIPVVLIKVPDFEEDLEKLNKVGNEYTEPTTPVTEKADESSKAFVGPYTPTPYIFRLGCDNICPDQHARSPPLWLLIDHTLAVIWSIFSPETFSSLGLGQLQWALTFLLTIKDENGKYPPDVQICIDVIENRLFTQFANAKIESEKQIPCGLQVCSPCYVPPKGGKRKENLSPIDEEPAQELQPKDNSGIATQTKFICPNAVKDQSMPVSATINSMLKSHSTSVHQLFKAGSSAANQISNEAFSLLSPIHATTEASSGYISHSNMSQG